MISFLLNEKWVVKFDMNSCWALLMYFTIMNRKSWLWFWIICLLGVDCGCISVMSYDFLVVCTYFWYFLRIRHLDWVSNWHNWVAICLLDDGFFFKKKLDSYEFLVLFLKAEPIWATIRHLKRNNLTLTEQQLDIYWATTWHLLSNNLTFTEQQLEIYITTTLIKLSNNLSKIEQNLNNNSTKLTKTEQKLD